MLYAHFFTFVTMPQALVLLLILADGLAGFAESLVDPEDIGEVRTRVLRRGMRGLRVHMSNSTPPTVHVCV